MKFNSALESVVTTAIKVNKVPFLVGEPAIGKSSFMRTTAENSDTKIFSVSVNQLADKADLTAPRLVPTEDGSSYKQAFFPHDIVSQAIQYAKDNPRETPLLFLDEINRTTSDITSAALTLITERRLGREVFPPNLRLVAAGNDKGNVVALDDASVSRFFVLRVEPDAHTFMDLMGDRLNPFIRSVLTKNPHMIFMKSQPESMVMEDGSDDDDDDQQNVYVSELLDTGEEMLQLTAPRTLEAASEFLNATSDEQLKEFFNTSSVIPARNGNANEGREITVLQEVLEGFLGNTQFVTLLLSEIIDSFSTGAPTTSAAQMPKPNCYDDLNTAGTIDELENLISQLTDREKSGSIAYALYDTSDNVRLLHHLLLQTDDMQDEHFSKTAAMMFESRLAQHKLDAMAEPHNANTPVGQRFTSLIAAKG